MTDKFHKLLYDYNGGNDAVYLEIDEKALGFNRYDADKGKRFDNWNEDITFYYDTTDGSIITDYIANDLVWLLITERFKSLLEEYASESIQFLPVKVMPVNEDIGFSKCYLANIVSLINALDLENSKYHYLPGDGSRKVLSVIKFALKRSKIHDIHIFRLKDDYFSIFISDTLKKAMKKNGITGCDFLEVKVV